MRLPRAALRPVLVALLGLGLFASTGATKTVKCRSGQVQVKIGKKTKCRPFKSVFPTPEVAEYRLTHLQAALQFDPYKRHGKKGKHARALPRQVAVARKEANGKFLEVLPQALALIDQANGGTAPSFRIRSERAAASGGCDAGGESTGAGNLNGVGVSGLGGGSGVGGKLEYTTSKGLTVRTTYATCGTTGFFLPPECPKADGSVDTQTHGTLVTTQEVRDEETVLSRSSSTLEETIKVHGKVAADARLDYIDVDYTQEAFVLAGGAGAPTVLRGSGTWTVRVNMRTGQYDLDGAKFTGSGDQGPLQKSNLASWVGQAIQDFREAEVGGGFLHTDGWSTFDRHGGSYCVEPTFSPEIDTVKVKKGQAGTLNVYAKARSDGGQATEARWELRDPDNAGFSPTTSDEAQPSINYTVHTSAPSGGKVKVTVRVTSTAGVGEKTWTEDIVGTKIGGTIEGSIDGGYDLLEWTGNLEYERDPADPAEMGGANGTYLLASGDYTVTASGGGLYGCKQSGVQHFTLTAGSDPGGMSVFGTGPDFGPPYTYSWFAGFMGHPTMNVVLSNCPMGNEGHNGEVVEIDAQIPLGDHGGAISSDGITFADSYSDDQSGVIISQSWSFEATP